MAFSGFLISCATPLVSRLMAASLDEKSSCRSSCLRLSTSRTVIKVPISSTGVLLQQLNADQQPLGACAVAHDSDGLIPNGFAAANAVLNRLPSRYWAGNSSSNPCPSISSCDLAQQAFCGLAGHDKAAGIIEKQHGLLQPLQQLFDIAAQIDAVLPRSAILLA